MINISRIALLCGWQTDSQPAVARRMLAATLELQRQAQARTVFMTGNLKVAEDDAEALVHAAKGAGAQFFKFTRRFPTIRALPDDRFETFQFSVGPTLGIAAGFLDKFAIESGKTA